MKSRVSVLVVGSVGVWAVASLVGRALWGETAIVYSGVALVVCLLPAAATMLWAEASRGSPDQAVVVVLGGTVVRMAVVLGVGLALYAAVPYFQQPTFWLWILAFYLLTLALEVGLLAAGPSATEDR